MADEALCYLEPVLIDSSLGTGVASINQLSNAAYELILQCAVRQSKGGIATGIGTSQNLKFWRVQYLVNQKLCGLRISCKAHTHQEDKTWQLS